MNPILRGVPWVTSFLLTACASTGKTSGEGGIRALVSLQDYRTGERFELASESHTNRVDYYSSARTEAARKVQTDEVMGALIAELERRGFAAHCQPGPAPHLASGDVVRWAMELEDGEQRSHWIVSPNSPGDSWKTFQDCRDTFLQLYNITVSFQTVSNPSGKQYFDQSPAGAAASKKR